MNVLFLTNKFITGGAERYILKKADYLLRAGHGVCIVSAGGDYTSQLQTLQIPFEVVHGLDRNLNLLEPSALLQIIAMVSRIVGKYQAEIIEIDSPGVLELGITAAYMHQVPFILNVFHEYAFTKVCDARLLEVCAHVGCLFSLSESIMSITSLHTGADLSNAKILPIFIDPEELANRDHKLDFASDLFVILAIARMTKDKAYVGVLMDEYVRFIAKAKPKKTRLVVVGDGEHYKRYKLKADRINKGILPKDNCIVMVGSRMDITTFYRRADVYVGMGTTVLEAAYHRKPVILASFYPNHGASIGYFNRTPYESVGEVISARVSFTPFSIMMCEVYTDEHLRRSLADEGYAKIEKLYLKDAIMEKWLAEYTTLIGNKDAILAQDMAQFIYKRDNLRIKIHKLQQLLKK